MLADGVAPDTVMYNAVINACEKSGRVREAFDVRPCPLRTARDSSSNFEELSW